jgi:hypothetical protein
VATVCRESSACANIFVGAYSLILHLGSALCSCRRSTARETTITVSLRLRINGLARYVPTRSGFCWMFRPVSFVSLAIDGGM